MYAWWLKPDAAIKKLGRQYPSWQLIQKFRLMKYSAHIFQACGMKRHVASL